MFSDTDFGAYLIALGLTCRNISDFFGHNLVDIMENRLQQSGDGSIGDPTARSCDDMIPG